MKLVWKILTCLALIVGLLVIMGAVRSLLNERQQRAAEVRQEIAQFSAGEQIINGPFLVIPYTETVATLKDITDSKGAVTATRWEESSNDMQLIIAPERFAADGKLSVEALRRGIFEAPVYDSALQLSGSFTLPDRSTLQRAPASNRERVSTRVGQPFIAMGISDVRGIRQLKGSAGSDITFEPGSGIDRLGSGVHAPLDWNGAAQELAFELKLQLAGTSQLLLQPVGKESSVQLAGNWPHPSFSGSYAPVSRQVNQQGFSARWQTSELATGGASASKSCTAENNEAAAVAHCGSESQLGLRLIDPVDRYVLNERTQKYAELFILLIFGAVFLMEVMKRLSVHPVQYALVGLSLAMFFLLTLSLSEHLRFAYAYWIAASASVALLGYYVSFMLAGWRRGSGFAAVLATLYGLLYGILQSEDMALLMGSLTLFGLLAAVMILTRKLDWSSLGGNDTPRPPRVRQQASLTPASAEAAPQSGN
ncbi:cell envelope integrity protein CreD [Chitinilyticum piscinae]|uniref:Cell envelope integrity protein CreD n=1 Tax=Chitinilyticum piscinae TaxID=2866724 RepID=A0A8J7FJ22_9NEIS|nr:cell envelope integrity protein CreD [Chitinilyticum piscinae]MBE9608367.1 cell envelope integrity protein CreD [Chitinilyticum piscinae]